MFWAITCESGKRYSQVPSESFHVSMAALEPKDTVPENKQVSLMIEHSGKEFLLCTLEYERTMQVNLDLQFNKGEEMVFFVNGEGTIHLSGYTGADDSFDISNALVSTSDVKPLNDIEVDEGDASPNESELGTSRLLTLDESGEDDSEDEYEPEADLEAQRALRADRQLNSKNKYFFDTNDVEISSSDDDEDEDEEDESDEDDDDDEEIASDEMDSDLSSSEAEDITEEKRKRKLEMPGPSSKRSRSNPLVPVHASGSMNSSNKRLKKLKEGEKSTNVSMETHANTSDREEEELNSSIGRTPMPKKVAFMKVAPSPSYGSPVLKQGATKNDKPLSSNARAESSESKSGEKKTKVVLNGVEIEDIRVGNGPVAKKGKFLHVYYVGKLENDKVFDSLKPGADKPLSFRLGRNEVIKGWDIGLEGMRVGGKRFVKVPPEMGYGKKGTGPIPGNSTLFFTVELKAVS